MGNSAGGKENEFFLFSFILSVSMLPFSRAAGHSTVHNYVQGSPIPLSALCEVWSVFVHSKWYSIVYALYKIIQQLCGIGKNIAADELEQEKGRERWNGTAISSITALFAYLEEALGLQDGAGRRELAQSRRCLRRAGYRNNVNLKSVKKQEAS